ncbi:hypothetical protein JL475_00295 [Streptomyces sp. M2CJ-2]|uniref:hypothetical protein n=1 Tax=Streptomyces sp. M2CJ-2 TaxID=2803948 RepID=UPI00192065D2|nr:hypothetical protein [Streptomyces sp. M2CJ-2]MBL3664485.1 hypothetical protein [Streptomyces sp. M2CJ-2]
MTGERERLQALRATAEEIVAGLPAWDNESPAVLVTFTDPVTRLRLGHWFVPATAAPQPQSRPSLRLVGEAS